MGDSFDCLWLFVFIFCFGGGVRWICLILFCIGGSEVLGFGVR